MHQCHESSQCSCRYIEAIDILYTHVNFRFKNLSTIVAFASTVPHQLLSSIRHVQLDWFFKLYGEPHLNPRWKEVCEALKSLQNLQELRIRSIYDTKRFRGPGDYIERDLFGLLRGIKRPKTFEVLINWRSDITDHGSDSCPYKLRTVEVSYSDVNDRRVPEPQYTG